MVSVVHHERDEPDGVNGLWLGGGRVWQRVNIQKARDFDWKAFATKEMRAQVACHILGGTVQRSETAALEI